MTLRTRARSGSGGGAHSMRDPPRRPGDPIPGRGLACPLTSRSRPARMAHLTDQSVGKTMEAAGAPRWRRLPEQRPDQITAAALEVFSQHGLEAARLEDVADRAGVSKGTIYGYFESKADLFRAVVHTTIESVFEDAAPPVAESGPAALEACVRRAWTRLRSKEFDAIYRLVLAEINEYPELAREYGGEVRARIAREAESALKKGVSAGEFTPGDVQVRSRMLVALLIKHAVWCARPEFVAEMGGLSEDDDEVLEQILDFYFAAIGAGRPGKGG